MIANNEHSSHTTEEIDSGLGRRNETMNLEIICSSCQGRLIANQPGVVVACPHCNAHLLVPESQTPALPQDFPLPFGQTDDSSATVDQTTFEEITDSGLPIAAAVASTESTDYQSPSHNATANPQQDPKLKLITGFDQIFDGSDGVVPKRWFVIAFSYASAVTICLIILLFVVMRIKEHQLESLPDVSSLSRDTGGFVLVPEEAKLPDGHTLNLGESNQFGSLKVSPLRVTREPVEIVLHDENNGDITQATDRPVIKLWLRFENVSLDQTFVPLGTELMSKRIVDQENTSSFRANQFVCQLADKRRNGQRVMLFDQPAESSWQLKGQNLNRKLAPGESCETYLATTTAGLDQLTGPLVWRIHLRKGINQESQTGVTTLVEVRFDSSAIQSNTEIAMASTLSPR